MDSVPYNRTTQPFNPYSAKHFWQIAKLAGLPQLAWSRDHL